MPFNCCLLGPSASGKTSLSIKLAQKINAHIISVDSVLVYQGLDIGSAKPNTAEQQLVPHHLIDICDIKQEYNVAMCVAGVQNAIKKVHAMGKNTIIVGGSMMYFNALINGLSAMPAQNKIAELSTEEKHQQLKKLDLDSYNRLHSNDSSRVNRAWQLAQQGTNIGEHWQNNNKSEKLDAHIFVIAPQKRQMLDEAIKTRIEQMFADGFIKEVQDILDSDTSLLDNQPKSLKTIGYSQVFDYLTGQLKVDIAELKLLIFYATRALVKRQTTWLNKIDRDLDIDCQLDINKKIEIICDFINLK